MVLSFFKPQHVFIDGKRPDTCDGYLKHFGAQVRAKRLVKIFHPDTFLPRPPGVKNLVREQNFLDQPLVSMFYYRNTTPSSMDMTGDNLSAILGVEASSDKLPRSTSKPPPSSGQHSAAEIVCALSAALEREVDLMEFDYLGFFRDAMGLFLEVDAILGQPDNAIAALIRLLTTERMDQKEKEAVLAELSAVFDRFLERTEGDKGYRARRRKA